MSDEPRAMWLGFEEIPQPRSPAETMELAFRAADLEDKAERRRAEELAATRRTDREDLAAVHRLLGRPARSHADVIAGYVAASEQADQWASFLEEKQARRAEQERERLREERVEQLEAELATASTRAERLSRGLTEAVEGWGAERRRAEGASFREARTYIRNNGEILGIR